MSNFSFFASQQGDGESSPLFPTANAVMNASDALMEALIANLLLTGGTAKEATFLMAIRLLIAVRSFFDCADGEWSTTPSCTLIGAYNALL